MSSPKEASPQDIVITGLGVITGAAKSRTALEGVLETGRGPVPNPYALTGFDAQPYMSNKRLLKTVSWYHGIGLAAIEACRKDAGLMAGDYAPERLGLFVGAAPSSCDDNVNYLPAVAAARTPAGDCPALHFGRTSQQTLGTTLLKGLPNNVLCYGSIIADAKGPNSNYLAGETSGHLSLLAAARNLRTGRLAAAIAGAYSHPTDAVITAMYQQRGLAKTASGPGPLEPFAANPAAHGTVGADGAVFYVMETRRGASRRGRPVLATFLAGTAAATGFGPCGDDGSGYKTLAHAMRTALAKAQLSPADVGAVFLSGSGVAAEDEAELQALSLAFAETRVKPAAACLAGLFGNLVEAGGLAEIGMWSAICRAGSVPASISLAANARLAARGFTATAVGAERRYALIARSSREGDCSVVVVGAPTT